ncbi:Protein scarlet, partial [Cryptotermes secundus]
LQAQLRLDRRTSNAERHNIVSELLVQVGLTGSASTLIGKPGQDKVLSGGEKKRLAFATELMTNPPLLFCDEPTTGLDSFSAQKLVEKMKEMTRGGRTIVCTIHQPSSEVFNMFNQLIILADGRIAFIGSTKLALEFFSKHGYECPETYSPADFFIRMLAITLDSEDECRRVVKRLCDEFAVSEAAREVELTVQLEARKGSACEVTTDKSKAPFWFDRFQWLTYRSFKQVLRDPSVQFLMILQKIALAVMVGLCFAGSVSETQTGIQSVQGALFMFVTENTFAPMYSTLAFFPLELPLFTREYRSGLYSTHLYYLSKMAAMLPGLTVEPLLFVLIAYWLTGLRNTLYAFLMTAMITTLTMNVSAACGCFFSNAFSSVATAMACLVPFDCVLMVTSGLFSKLSTLPYYISWTQNLSWLMYSNEAMSIVQWVDVRNITCELQNPDLPCLKNGSEVLDKYNFRTEHLWRNIVAMTTLYFIFHLLGYLCLRSRARNS